MIFRKNTAQNKYHLKKCVVCNSDISVKAKKCNQCCSYQSRFKRLGSDLIPVLSLVVAIVAIMPYLIEHLEPAKTNVKIELAGFSDYKPFFIITNSGNRSGWIKEAYANGSIGHSSGKSRSTVTISGDLFSHVSHRDLTIHPDQLIHFESSLDLPRNFKSMTSGSLSFVFEVVGYDSIIDTTKIEFNLEELKELLKKLNKQSRF